MSVVVRLLEDSVPGSLRVGQRNEADSSRATVGRGNSTPNGRAIALTMVANAFGSRVVLDQINLAIRPGEFVAIVGRSGGGKSTLLRLIAGLDRPTSGAVEIDRAPVLGVQKCVRLMFQDARLLPWQRVGANVGIARGPDWRGGALRALQSVGLADRADDWPRVLSGGQRQRVALARALVSEPNVLLLDEPFGALDALTRIEMHQLLESLWRERRFTAVLITHDVNEAVALADRVLVLRDSAIALDLRIALPRPRREASDPHAARLQAQILAAV